MNIENSTVLVIGATGTLGKRIVKGLLERGVRSIRAYSRHEESMFWLRQEYGDDKLRYLIGDIRDKERLNMAMAGVDIVINCAAMKHVRLCQENPFEASKTNVQGVQIAVECAIKNNVDTFVQISTDKAVNPKNTYGATKLLSEQLVLQAPEYQGNNRTKFCVFRSGNIINSSGSCLQIWEKQSKSEESLTVTNLDAVRYMARDTSIVNAILEAIPNVKNGLYVLNMPKYTVRELLAKYFPFDDITIIGLRPDEKLEEELFTQGEKYTLITCE